MNILVLELPPPPESWIPKIKEMVDKEMMEFEPQDPVVSQQVQSAVDSIIGCESEDTSTYLLEEGDKVSAISIMQLVKACFDFLSSK